jgi:hypothetical protein
MIDIEWFRYCRRILMASERIKFMDYGHIDADAGRDNGWSS